MLDHEPSAALHHPNPSESEAHGLTPSGDQSPNQKIADRFSGPKGAERLVSTLLGQKLVQGNAVIASELAGAVKLRDVEPGEFLLRQRGTDTELFLIISGRVEVLVHGRRMAVREKGNHVGEMGIVDPTARRCACVRAIEKTVVATIAETEFTPIANRHPELWRCLALELAERLRQRNAHVREPNPKPVVFIGSSAEGLDAARELEGQFSHDQFEVSLWTTGVFGPSLTNIEALEEMAEKADFAILVVSPDDRVESRGQEQDAARDNVVCEIGLFTGELGRKRTFIVKPRGKDVKIPTDLLGVIPLEYAQSRDMDLQMGPVANELRKIIKKLGAR